MNNYEIILTKIDEPIKNGSLTNKGIVERSNGNHYFINDFRIPHHIPITNDVWAIKVQLRFIHELSEPKLMPISDNKEFEFKYREQVEQLQDVGKKLYDKLNELIDVTPALAKYLLKKYLGKITSMITDDEFIFRNVVSLDGEPKNKIADLPQNWDDIFSMADYSGPDHVENMGDAMSNLKHWFKTNFYIPEKK